MATWEIILKWIAFQFNSVGSMYKTVHQLFRGLCNPLNPPWIHPCLEYYLTIMNPCLNISPLFSGSISRKFPCSQQISLSKLNFFFEISLNLAFVLLIERKQKLTFMSFQTKTICSKIPKFYFASIPRLLV